MYRVPLELDLTRFVGSRLIDIGIALYNTSFHFEVAPLDYLVLNALGRWEGATPTGKSVGGRARDGSERYDENLEVGLLIGSHVVSAAVRDPRTIELVVRGDVALRFFDDNDEYESMTISGLGDTEIII